MKIKQLNIENEIYKEKLKLTFVEKLLELSSSKILIRGGTLLQLLRMTNRHSFDIDLSMLKTDLSFEEELKNFENLLRENSQYLGIKEISFFERRMCFEFVIKIEGYKLGLEFSKGFFDAQILDAKVYKTKYNNLEFNYPEIEKIIAEKISTLFERVNLSTSDQSDSFMNALYDLNKLFRVEPIDNKRIKEIYNIIKTNGIGLLSNEETSNNALELLETLFNKKHSNRPPYFKVKDYLAHVVQIRYQETKENYTIENIDFIVKCIKNLKLND